jgi:hypothetical protein
VRKGLSLISLLIILIFRLSPCVAAESDASNFFENVNYKSIEVGGIYVIQGSGYSLSGTIAYTPAYRFNPTWRVGLNLGATYLKLDDLTRFAVTQYLVTGTYEVNQYWSIQLQSGLQSWWMSSGSKTALAVGPKISYSPSFKLSQSSSTDWLANLWASYLPVFQTKVAHEFSLGLGIQF